MWNKLSLQVKITALTILTLTILCAGLTTAAILNTSIFYDPIAYAIDKKPLDGGYTGEEHHIENADTITAIDEIYIKRLSCGNQDTEDKIIARLMGAVLRFKMDYEPNQR